MKDISLSQHVEYSPFVLSAVKDGRPVVAFETGFFCRIPGDNNLRTLKETENLIWKFNCVPAPLAVINGHFKAGLNDAEKEALMEHRRSVERSELPALVAKKSSACCNPSAALALAKLAGIVTLILQGVKDGTKEENSLTIYDRMVFMPRLPEDSKAQLLLRGIPMVNGNAEELAEAWLCQQALKAPEAVVYDGTDSWSELCRLACATDLEIRTKSNNALSNAVKNSL